MFSLKAWGPEINLYSATLSILGVAELHWDNNSLSYFSFYVYKKCLCVKLMHWKVSRSEPYLANMHQNSLSSLVHSHSPSHTHKPTPARVDSAPSIHMFQPSATKFIYAQAGWPELFTHTCLTFLLFPTAPWPSFPPPVSPFPFSSTFIFFTFFKLAHRHSFKLITGAWVKMYRSRSGLFGCTALPCKLTVIRG